MANILNRILRTQRQPIEEEARKFRAEILQPKHAESIERTVNNESPIKGDSNRLTDIYVLSYDGKITVSVQDIGDVTVSVNAKFGMQPRTLLSAIVGGRVRYYQSLEAIVPSEKDDIVKLALESNIFKILGHCNDSCSSFHSERYNLAVRKNDNFIPHDGIDSLQNEVNGFFWGVEDMLEVSAFIAGGRAGPWGRAYSAIQSAMSHLPYKDFPEFGETSPSPIPPHMQGKHLGDAEYKFQLQWTLPNQPIESTDRRVTLNIGGKVDSYVAIDFKNPVSDLELGDVALKILFQGSPPEDIRKELYAQIQTECETAGIKTRTPSMFDGTQLYVPLVKVGILNRDIIPSVLDSGSDAAAYVNNQSAARIALCSQDGIQRAV